MPNPAVFFNAVLSALAPAHARRKRARSTPTATISDFSNAEGCTSHQPEAAQEKLQAAHAARRADEMRSAF